METKTVPQVAQETTVGDLVERYLLSSSLAQSTLDVRRRALLWAFKDNVGAPIQELTGNLLGDLFISKKDLAGGVWLNVCGAAIRAFVKWLLEREILSRNPSRFWPSVKSVSQRSVEPITTEEREKLIAYASSSMRTFLLLGFYTGLRRANLCGLRWEWISASWIVTIPAEQFKQRRAHSQPLHSRVIEHLTPLRQVSGLVMPDLPSPGNVGESMKAIARRAGIDPRKTYPHSLRAAFASSLSDAGCNLKQICELGGWQSVEVVSKRYIRAMSPEMAKGLTERI